MKPFFYMTFHSALFIGTIASAAFSFSIAHGSTAKRTSLQKPRKQQVSSLNKEDLLVSRQLVAVSDCNNDTFVVNRNYFARSFYYKSIQEKTLTIVRDAVDQEVLYKELTTNVVVQQEKFEGTNAQYHPSYLRDDLKDLLSRCNAHRDSSKIEIGKNVTN